MGILGDFFMKLPVNTSSIEIATEDLIHLREKLDLLDRFVVYLKAAAQRKDRKFITTTNESLYLNVLSGCSQLAKRSSGIK